MALRLFELHELLEEIAKRYGVTPVAVRSRRRFPRLVRIRQEFCYRAMTETRRSVSHIGTFLGQHHSTILYHSEEYAKRTKNEMRNYRNWTIARGTLSRRRLLTKVAA